jgi:hypothetical protein
MSKIDKMAWVEAVPEANTDLIGKPPSRIIRYGAVLILSVLIILLVFSYFIQVPEVVVAEAVVRPVPFPVIIRSPASGMVNTDVREGQWVKTGSALFGVDGLVVPSPGSGKVVLLRTGQRVDKNDTVMALLDSGAVTFFAVLRVPVENSGKIRPGQEVSFTLPAFPARQYGMLKGRVENIAVMPVSDRYEVTVALPRGLMTNGDYKIGHFICLTGAAAIVIRNRSLLGRIFQRSF